MPNSSTANNRKPEHNSSAKLAHKIDTEQLIKENLELKAKLEKLKNTNQSHSNRFKWRSFFKWLSISLAGAIFVVASIILYIGMTLTNTDRFMKVAEPLARQPAVQEAVVTKTTDALFQQVDVDSLALEVLPDKVDFLAPTVSDQIQKYTKEQAEKIVASESFQQKWSTSVRKAHERFISGLKNYEGNGIIDVNDLFASLSQRLEGGKLQFLAGKQLPPKVGNIVIIQADWLPAAHSVVSNFQTFRVLTIMLFLLLLVLAVWLSSNRRKTIIQLAAMISIISFALLVTLRVLRTIVLSNADPNYQQAATEIWNVLSRPFAIQLITTLVIGLAVISVAWLGSQSRSAVLVRSRINHLFAGKLHESLFEKENVLTLWVGRYEKILLTVIGVGFVVSLLFIELTLGSLVGTILTAILASFAIVSLSADNPTKT